MADLAQHACEHRRFLVLGAATDLAEAERAQRTAVPLGLADLGLDLRDPDARHYDSSFLRRLGFSASAVGSSASAVVSLSASAACSSATTATASAASSASCSVGAGGGSTSLMRLPRMRATSSGRRSPWSATTVAFAMLIGFVAPRLLASTL